MINFMEANFIALEGEYNMSLELQEKQDPVFGVRNTIVMDDVPEYTTIDYDIYDEKDFQKYINDIEKSVRSSMEYQQFIQYLREYMDMNQCAFFKNINNMHTSKIKIHLHHYPFTLYDIVVAVFNKRSKNNESLELEMVALEVMYIHYFLYVGLVPLAETAHELVHKQLLFIPLDIVLGKYEDFISMYEPFIAEDAMERYNTYKEMTANYNEALNMQILQSNPVYIQLPGGYDIESNGLVSMQKIIDLAKNKLSDANKLPDNKIIDLEDYDNNTEKKMIKPFILL